jgi:D-3-phosphoglycerate dehydrogenase
VFEARTAEDDGPPVIVYCGPPEARHALESAVGGRARLIVSAPDIGSVTRGLRRASAYLDASLKVRLTPALLQEASRLRVVAVAATGADHVDAEALRTRAIPLLTLADQRDLLQDLTPAAEHSWLLLMACARSLMEASDDVLRGNWDRLKFPGVMLKGKTIGIVGCGRIGTWMARYAHAFGMRCLGYDTHAADWPADVARVELDVLLANADFVTIHVPLTSSTHGFFDADCFARMKEGAIFVNTSRGAVIDEAALLDALQTRRIAAAGVDVLAHEPDIGTSALWQYARTHRHLLITPHIGGFSPDAVRIVVAHTARRILDYLTPAAPPP